MGAFGETIASWHDFYIMVGTAAATLVGLLFVSLSLNSHLIAGDENTGARLMAAQTFSNFLSVLMFAVLFLIPDPGRWGLGVPLAFIGCAGLYGAVRRSVTARRLHTSSPGSLRVSRHGLASALCFLALIVVAVTVMLGHTDGLYWLIPVMLVLIAEASRNAWRLLLQPHDRQAGT
jgi:hypothetical protein